MNKQITRLAVAGLVLMVALVVATTYWQTWAAAGLADRQDNAIERVAQFTIKRGEITDRGRVLARTRARKLGGRTLYFRRYPQGKLTAHIVGYSTPSRFRSGLERSLNDYLTASNANLSTVVRSTLDKLKGGTVTGNDVRLTMDLRGQQAAYDALAGRCGAVVAIDVATGKLLVSAASPTYNPNLVEGKFDLIGKIRAPCTPVAALYNRATKGLYAPGSTFKVVTTAALLRAGVKTTDTVDCPKTITVEGKVFKNFEGEAAGPVLFARDFAQSCNTAFVSLAKRLEPDALTRTARDFGLGRTSASQVPAGRDAVERAATMIGQDRIVASPLAMAGVAATVADGRWRAPRLVATDRHQSGPALDQGELSTLRTLMRSVVTSGTGTALAPVPGEVAGKSGTAEYGGGNPPPTHAWFIAFRGDLAVAVLVENGRSGGSVAAPIAARFFQALGAAQTTAPPP